MKDSPMPLQMTVDPGSEIFSDALTLRDYFAGQAVQAMAKLQSLNNIEHHQKAVAWQAYRMADAMLKAREEQS